MSSPKDAQPQDTQQDTQQRVMNILKTSTQTLMREHQSPFKCTDIRLKDPKNNLTHIKTNIKNDDNHNTQKPNNIETLKLTEKRHQKHCTPYKRQ